MTTQPSLKKSSRPSSHEKTKPVRTALGRRLDKGLKEVLTHVKGEKLIQGYEIHVPNTADKLK